MARNKHIKKLIKPSPEDCYNVEVFFMVSIFDEPSRDKFIYIYTLISLYMIVPNVLKYHKLYSKTGYVVSFVSYFNRDPHKNVDAVYLFALCH